MNTNQLDPKAVEYDPETFHMEAAANLVKQIDSVITTTKAREALTFTYLHTQLRWAHAEISVFRALETHMKNRTMTEDVVKNAMSKLAQLRANIKGEAQELRRTNQPSTEEAAANE